MVLEAPANHVEDFHPNRREVPPQPRRPTQRSSDKQAASTVLALTSNTDGEMGRSKVNGRTG